MLLDTSYLYVNAGMTNFDTAMLWSVQDRKSEVCELSFVTASLLLSTAVDAVRLIDTKADPLIIDLFNF
jgi:hypothetical protein